MATAEITNRTFYNTYYNSSSTTIASTNANYRAIGYSNSNGSYRFTSCYKFVLPTVNGTITSVTLTPYIYNKYNDDDYIPAGKTWKISISDSEHGGLVSSFLSGYYSTSGTFTKTFSNASNIGSYETAVMSPITFGGTSDHPFTSGETIYIYVYSGAAQYNMANISSLLGYVTYTPTTYYATKGTCTYANASVTPTSGTSGTSYTFKAWTNANDDNYIYGNLKWSYGAGSGGFTDPSYASGYGGTQSETKTGSFSKNFTYTATADRWKADPGNATSITASNITATSAKITVNASLTTTFLDSYYYITATNSGDIAGSLTSSTKFSRSTGYINLTSGLTTGASNTRYVYAFNSYNNRYYKIGSTSFTTDASSYTQTTTVSSKGITDATINVSTPSPTTNLDGKTYFSINSNSSPVSSLSIIGSGSYGGNIVISNLQSDKSYTLYTYVKSSVSGKYYPTGIVDTFSTLAPNYTADCLVTGIGTDCAYLFATNFSSTNLDGYYVTDVDYGDDVIPEADIINYKVGLRESKFVSDLVPGMTYTYYFYVLPSSGNLQKIDSLTFTTRSSVVYYGENLIPHRIYMVRNGRLEGVNLYREGTPEILYLEDGSTITTSDGLVFNTTEGDIDI